MPSYYYRVLPFRRAPKSSELGAAQTVAWTFQACTDRSAPDACAEKVRGVRGEGRHGFSHLGIHPRIHKAPGRSVHPFPCACLSVVQGFKVEVYGSAVGPRRYRSP